MPASPFEASVQQAIYQRYREKYGDVQIQVDMVHLTAERVADVQFTLSDHRGFITRYYGRATCQTGQLHLDVRSI